MTPEQRTAIVALNGLGKSQREIAKEVLGRSSRKSTVGDFLRKLKEDVKTMNNDEKIKRILLDLGDVLEECGGVYNSNFQDKLKEIAKLSVSAINNGFDVDYTTSQSVVEEEVKKLKEDNEELKSRIQKAAKYLMDDEDYDSGYNALRALGYV